MISAEELELRIDKLTKVRTTSSKKFWLEMLAYIE